MFHGLCPAKLNLFLKILRARSDGYHDIESLLVFTDLCDELEVVRSDAFSLKASGEFAKMVDPSKNCFTEILDFFAKNFGVSRNLHIHIKKNIPVGAGLGGGSSDAAQFMNSLNEIFALNLNKEELQKISFQFGSDIAFFFEDQASIIKGRGEVYKKFSSFEEMPALLIYPRINLSTAEVYNKYKLDHLLNTRLETQDTLVFCREGFGLDQTLNLGNDLEDSAFKIAPILIQIISVLKDSGATFAKMSGSGSVCFGIFTDYNLLKRAASFLFNHFPDFWIRESKILFTKN